jgi:hypothetical protein
VKVSILYNKKQILALENNRITGAGGEAVLRAVGPNMGLRVLSLAHNAIGRGVGDGHGAAHEIPGMLSLNNCLETLDLTDCDLNGAWPRFLTSQAQFLFRALRPRPLLPNLMCHFVSYDL